MLILKSLVIGVLSSIIVFLIMGQYQNGYLRVQRLEVVDENGKAVIKLGSVDNNGSIETYNASGNLIIGITSSVDGEGAINTYNANEKQIIRLGSTTDGEGTISTFDSDGKQIVQISSTVNGEGRFPYNNEGYEIVKLTSSTNGDGYISTSNNEGIEMVQLSSTSKGKGVISTFLIKEKDKKSNFWLFIFLNEVF